MYRVVFMGSPGLAVPSLKTLAAHPQCEVAGVITQPDRPAGRGRRLKPSPVRMAAEELGLQVHTPEKMRGPEALETLRAAQPALVIVCAYGRILPDEVLNLPPLGCYNIHFSLLPRWRGASPLQAALLAGDAETGVSLQRMVRELDAGPIAAETPPFTIGPRDTAESLEGRLAEAAADLLAAVLPALLTGAPPLREQDPARATYCRVIRKEAGAVDWGKESAEEIERKLRAYTPWPGCFSYLEGRRLGLVRLEVAQADPRSASEGRAARTPQAPGTILPGGLVPAREGLVRLLEVKPEGRGAMSFSAFLNGAPQALGMMLLSAPAKGIG